MTSDQHKCMCKDHNCDHFLVKECSEVDPGDAMSTSLAKVALF